MGDGLEITLFGLVTAKANGTFAIAALTAIIFARLGFRLISDYWRRRRL
jgi:hypothetical protein